MAKVVSAIWRYAGYGSLSRSLFDADLAGGGKIPTTPLSEPQPSDHGEDGEDNCASSTDESDDEAVLAWAHHLSEEEEEEEEEEAWDRSEYCSGYESDTSEDLFSHQIDWDADGGGEGHAGPEQDYILSIGPYIEDK